jgi:hypothetical protein
MKTNFRLLSLLLMAILPFIASAQEFEWVIKPQYENATSFTDANLAAVQQHGNWGYVDKSGTWVIKPQFGKAESFKSGLAAVQLHEFWGFIDSNGNWIIKPLFKDVTDFSEGLAGVCKENWGFIDKTGTYAFEYRFEDLGKFSEGLAAARQKGKWGFIDKTGAWVIKPRFNDVCVFKDGLAGVCLLEQWGFIDKTGNGVIEVKYEDAGVFNEGLVEVKLDNKWGYIDKTGAWVIKPVYKTVTSFSNGLAAVCQKGKWGYMDKTGTWVIQPQFDEAVCFAEKSRIAEVNQGGKWGFIERPSISSFVKKVVEKNVNEWQKKGEFEKTSEYQKRVNDKTRNIKIQQFTEEAIKQRKAEYAQKIQWNELQLSEYDADNETYLIKSAKLGDFAVPVSIADAPSFKQNWANMKFSNSDFTVNEEQFYLAKVTISNSTNDKSYQYDSKQATTYAANNITYNFAPVEVDIQQNEVAQNNTKIDQNNTVLGTPDVDLNIPNMQVINPHAYALIIGNEDYRSFQSDLSSEANVAFAVNDATIFRKYIVGTMGIQESNMRFLSNATSGQMNQAIAWINKLIQKEGGEAEVIVYYAGHGLPDEQTHEPYIIPVDVSGTNLQSAIKLQTLYTKLTEYPAKRVTVFMDACFSGGSRGQGLLASRGVKVKPKEDMLLGNIVVFTSSSGEQSSLPFKVKQHGIFTYYLLKKIQETNGDVSYNDLYNYVKKEVDLNCVKVNSKEQTPNILYSSELGANWMEWKLK